jgi:hypothetical protein
MEVTRSLAFRNDQAVAVHGDGVVEESKQRQSFAWDEQDGAAIQDGI